MWSIKDARNFFALIDSQFQQYKNESLKDIVKLIFVIMGLNHLHEWIAPGYRPRSSRVPSTYAESFCWCLYHTEEHCIVRRLCNHTKHLTSLKGITTKQNEATLVHWDSMASVPRLNAPLAYIIDLNGDRRDITLILDEAIDFYRKHWFEVTN